MKKLISFLLLVLLPFMSLLSQEVEMADVMRSNGKIYVVVAVMAIVFLGIAFFLFYLDSRIKKIEKRK